MDAWSATTALPLRAVKNRNGRGGSRRVDWREMRGLAILRLIVLATFLVLLVRLVLTHSHVGPFEWVAVMLLCVAVVVAMVRAVPRRAV